MHLAVVACGERLGEAVNMLKTAAMLSSRAVRFHIFAEDQLHANIKATVSIIFVTSTCEVKRKERFSISKSIFFTAGFLASFHFVEIQLRRSPHFIPPREL